MLAWRKKKMFLLAIQSLLVISLVRLSTLAWRHSKKTLAAHQAQARHARKLFRESISKERKLLNSSKSILSRVDPMAEEASLYLPPTPP
ncbi:hypothetical protein CJ030_MR3G003076 [Morella rubra]|uniref:Uncharacterized protein n=1 Tax=Morella rubra TaxID=262757 RepID=A0A6A1W4U7_9ROSI|nr:hypothetical protein CJ030_MR3G003076 [Morella rubra]